MYSVLDILHKGNPTNLIEQRLVGNYVIQPTYSGMTVFFGDKEDRDKSQVRLIKFFGTNIDTVSRETETIDK